MQRDAITPDLTTGAYYEYNLRRTIILFNYKGRQVLVSISKQIGESDVGRKGVIIGNDSDWSYYYSGEPGTTKTGLGWAKSYIYDYFSVCIYVENAETTTVRTGVFQWLRAGWSRINFVKSSDILRGMKRFADNSRSVLESPRLPAPSHMISAYQSLLSMPQGELVKKYTALQQAMRSSAIQIGKISKSAANEPISCANVPKDQIVEELMLEYLKMALGKPTPLGQQLSILPSSPLL
jgi:hypothetical protein